MPFDLSALTEERARRGDIPPNEIVRAYNHISQLDALNCRACKEKEALERRVAAYHRTVESYATQMRHVFGLSGIEASLPAGDRL